MSFKIFSKIYSQKNTIKNTTKKIKINKNKTRGEYIKRAANEKKVLSLKEKIKNKT